MSEPSSSALDWRLVAKYCGVSLLGFATDVAILQLALHMGLEPAWARVVSLVCAMHVTFLLNGLHVFRRLDRRRAAGQWARYMLSNACGNLLNYWLFVTLVSTRWPLVANPAFAVAVGSSVAWTFNFTATRFLVFRDRRRRRASRPDCAP